MTEEMTRLRKAGNIIVVAQLLLLIATLLDLFLGGRLLPGIPLEYLGLYLFFRLGLPSFFLLEAIYCAYTGKVIFVYRSRTDKPSKTQTTRSESIYAGILILVITLMGAYLDIIFPWGLTETIILTRAMVSGLALGSSVLALVAGLYAPGYSGPKPPYRPNYGY